MSTAPSRRAARRRAAAPYAPGEETESIEVDVEDEALDDADDHDERAARAERAESFRSGGSMGWIGPDD